MNRAKHWIDYLQMIKHVEGGYYKETYKHQELFLTKDNTKRPLSTSIYFLILKDDVSHFHRLKSDEIWYFHEGDPLCIAVIDEKGQFHEYHLGLAIEKGQQPQILVPANSIFGSYIKDSQVNYSLVSCMVSYGFNFTDFELFNRQSLTNEYPQYSKIITKLTKD